LPRFHDSNLLIGFDDRDDASAYKLDEQTVLIQTVDIFPPVVDNPYHYGQIAAANALSDVYAMGGNPKLAMNILCLPEDLPKEMIKEILRGGYEKVAEAGAIITGGHTIKDSEPKYGLSVSGFVHPDKLLSNNGAKPGDVLILTKPLGSGILTTASKAGLLSTECYKEMVDTMTMLNKTATEVINRFSVQSCTDITGFGFLGHLYEMASASKCTMTIEAREVPVLSEALDLAGYGILPAGIYSNRDYLQDKVQLSQGISIALADVLFDPQTSGGLLISAPEHQAGALFRALQDSIPYVKIVGYAGEANSSYAISVV